MLATPKMTYITVPRTAYQRQAYWNLLCTGTDCLELRKNTICLGLGKHRGVGHNQYVASVT